MFDSFNDFQKNNEDKNYEQYKNESYVLGVRKLNGMLSESFYIFVKNRLELSELAGELKEDEYVVLNIIAFNCKTAQEVLKEIRDKDKPDNLNFG